MSRSRHELFRELGVYALGDLLLKSAGIVTLPLYSREFSPSDFGVIAFVAAATSLLNIAFTCGGNGGMNRFYFEAKSDAERQSVVTTWIAFILVLNVAFLAVCVPLSSSLVIWSFGSSELHWVYVFAILNLLPMNLNLVMAQVLRNRFRVRASTALNVLSAVLVITFGLTAVFIFHLGLEGMFAGIMLAGLAIVPLRVWSIRRELGLRLSAEKMKAMIQFSIPLIPSMLAFWIMSGADRFMIERLIGREELGIFSIAVHSASLLQFANGILGTAWVPHATKLYEESPDRASAECGKAMTYILALFGALTILSSIWSREIVLILTTPEYARSAWLVGPLALGIMFAATTQVSFLGIYFRKKIRFMLIYSFVAASINIGLNFLWIPEHGIIGAAWATVAAQAFLAAAYLATSQVLWKVQYEAWKSTACLVLTVSMTIVTTSLFEVGPGDSWWLKGSLSLVSCAALMLLSGRGAKRLLKFA